MYDIIIIGAGPAGASAALEFARRSDLRILILDKCKLPRDKPCGGAMPSSVEKLLQLDLSPIVSNRTHVLKLYYRYKREVTRQTVGSSAPLLVNRSAFDMYVLEEACKLAPSQIDVRDNSTVNSVEEYEGGVEVKVNGKDTVYAKYLIAADGALGKTTSMVGLRKKRKFATSLDAEIITDGEFYHAHKDMMIMNYFCLPFGYGWVFPKEQNRFSCGVGTWGKPINLYRELEKFLMYFFPSESIRERQIRGFPIPVYQGIQQISTEKVLIAGDAAGLVDPVSGEGIRYALYSGKIAAIVLIEALESFEEKNRSISDNYQKMIENKIGRELKQKLFFVSLPFHSSPEMFYRTFVEK